MQRNQWKLASEQLLGHWRRSGITQLPIASEVAVQTANAWLVENAAGYDSALDEIPLTNAAQPVNERMRASDAPAKPSPPGLTGNVDPLTVAEGTPKTSSKSYQTPTSPPASPATTTSKDASAESPQPALGKWLSHKQDFVERQSTLDRLNEQVVACRKCEDIVCRRQRTVFGVGPTTAKLVMFGEAPGAEEDRAGEPFVGAAGQLMDKILVASGLKRQDVYIMNALKCRPPNNRTPTDAEIEHCRPFFETQLETIQPEYIVCWGAVAVRAVLKSTESVGRLRGKFHTYRGAKVLVTYHPAYLLRNPDAKKLTWEDMKMLMRELGIPIPGKG